MVAPIDVVEIPEDRELDTATAALLMDVKISRIQTLVREGDLPTPLTIGALRQYNTEKGDMTGRRSADGTSRYEVYLTLGEKAALVDKGIRVEDPREKAKEREERQMAAAEASLAEWGVNLNDLQD